MDKENKVDEKFQKAALFDLQFESSEQKMADSHKDAAQWSKETSEQAAKRENEAGKAYSELNQATSRLEVLDNLLQQAQKDNPKLAAQAEAYLSQVINTDLSELEYSTSKRDKFSKEADVDGSKKGLWGK